MTRAQIRSIRKATARRAFALATHERVRPLDFVGWELLGWMMDWIDERAGVR